MGQTRPHRDIVPLSVGTKGVDGMSGLKSEKVVKNIYRRRDSLQIKKGYKDKHGNYRRTNETIKGTDARALARAQAVLADIEEQLAAGTFTDEAPEIVPTGEESTMSVETLMDKYLKAGRLGWQRKTLESYTNTLRRIRPLPIAAMEIGQVNREAVSDMFAMLKHQGTSDSMLRRVHTVLGQAFTFAVADEWIGSNPVKRVKKPANRTVKQELRIPERDDVRDFLDGLRATDPDWAALVGVVLASGLRRSEIAGLQHRNIDWETSTIRVESQVDPSTGELKPLKTGSSNRTIPLDAETMQILREQQERQADRSAKPISDDAFVFAPTTKGERTRKGETKKKVKSFNRGAMIPWQGSQISKKWLKLRKGTPLEHVKFHDLRHTHASFLLSSGAPIAAVSKRLGHAQVSITLDTYAHVMPGDGQALADIAGDYLSPTE